jgi:hypothetical protein
MLVVASTAEIEPQPAGPKPAALSSRATSRGDRPLSPARRRSRATGPLLLNLLEPCLQLEQISSLATRRHVKDSNRRDGNSKELEPKGIHQGPGGDQKNKS